MANKKRILLVNEYSQLNTGFSTYWYYVLPYLFNTDKYEIAEQAVYTHCLHPKINDTPWKVYPNEPDPRNAGEIALYQKDKINQFGKWKFEQICLDFKPDIVIDIRDPWMSSWINQSVYRQYFHYMAMPTVDGQPQKLEWLQDYQNCNTLLTYSEWAKNVLEAESGGKIKIKAVASPGADIKTFVPKDKAALRSAIGLQDNLFIVQTVMRNQPRKLFPDMLRMFALYLKKCQNAGRDDLASKSFMHWHTTNPDLGWNIPDEIRKHKLSHKVLFTYMCDTCNIVNLGFYQGDSCVCQNCHKSTMRLPNTAMGVSRETLANLMALPDIYIQYSICLAKGQEVLSDNGWKPIEEIQINDKVLTHTGQYQRVLNTFVNNLGNRKMYKVSVDSDIENLIGTEDHPIYAITKKNIAPDNKNGAREYLGTQLRLNKKLPTPDWVPINELSNGDLVCQYVNQSIIDVEKIDLADYAKENDVINYDTIDISCGDSYPRYIDIDEEFCKLLGLFAADGCSGGNNSIRITLHNREKEYQDFVINNFTKLCEKAISVDFYQNRNAVDISLYSTIHQKLFKEILGSGLNKCLPKWVQYLPLNKQLMIICGLFMGDGHYNKKNNVSVYVTISKTLCDQVKVLLQRNKIYYNLHIDYRKNQKDGKNRQPQYRFEVAGNIANNEFVTKRSSTNSLYIDNFYLQKIKSIEEVDYNDKVFNIEVENDNSFITKLCVTHNCEGYGMPPNDAKACGIPIMAVDYSAMSEQAHAPGGIPIKVQRYFQESTMQTGQLRALPDNEDTAEKLFDFACKTKEQQTAIGREGREFVEKYYSWESVAKIWEEIIDATPVPDQSQTWLSPPKTFTPNLSSIPQNVNNQQFVYWCCHNVLGQPDAGGSPTIQRIVGLLEQGFEQGQDGEGRPVRMPVDRNKVLQMFINQINQRNALEEQRYAVATGQNNQPSFRFTKV